MQFARALKLARRGLLRRRSVFPYLFRLGPKKMRPPDPKRATAAHPKNSLLGLPLELRLQIYECLVPELSTAESLRAIQGDRFADLACANLSATCRQIYCELAGHLPTRRLFAVTGLLQHCISHQHYLDRFPRRDQDAEFEYHSYTENLDRDGGVISSDGGSNYSPPSVHGTRTVEWYTLRRCPRCELSGRRILAIHPSQLAHSVRRLVLPCCLCSASSFHPSTGIDIHGLKQGVFLTVGGGTGLDPTEIILQCCTCRLADHPLYQISEFGRHLDYLARGLPKLERIIVFYCRRRPRDLGGTSGVLDFPAEVAESSTLLRTCDPQYRVNVEAGVVWQSDGRQLSSQGANPGRTVYRKKDDGPATGSGGGGSGGGGGGERGVRLHFYDSFEIGGRECVFDKPDSVAGEW